MKILVASHTYTVDLNCEKFKTLAALEPGIEVTIAVPKVWKPGGVQNKIVKTRPWSTNNFRVVPLSNFSQNNQGLLCFGADLVSLMKQFRPNFIQVEQGVKSLAYAQMISLNRLLNLQAKNCFFTWWNLPYTCKFPLSTLEAYNLRHSHGIISGNQDGVDVLRDRGYQGPTCVLPQLGVDEALFCPKSEPELAASHQLAPQDFVIGFVGRFVPEKGLRTLATALDRLIQTHSNSPWKVLLLGRGPLKQELEERARDGGWRDRLRIIEGVPHDQVQRYINLMSTLVLPSETTQNFKTLSATGWKEQFGHVLIEAMACQVPVIGSDSGEIPNVIQTSGLVFPEGQAEVLGDRLRALIDSPTLQEAVGGKGYTRAMAHYTNRALAKEQLAFYRSL
jgi:L-malate glycosyltransferase